uniref:Microtubule-associated protein n=1 Tax=Culicoides sonorensis TaxID=179676 RepID=A0A336LIK0_CULSO
MNFDRPQISKDEVQLGSQGKPITLPKSQSNYQSPQQTETFNTNSAIQFSQVTRPVLYQNNTPQTPTNANFNYPQYNAAPQPMQQTPFIRPMVQPSPNMNFRPNNVPEATQAISSHRQTQDYSINQSRDEQKPQYNIAPVQYKPTVQQNYSSTTQVIQTQRRAIPTTSFKDDVDEDTVVSGRLNTPPITSSVQIAGYQNGTQSARPFQAPRPQAIELTKRSDSLRSSSSSPEPKFNTGGSPDQIYSPTARQSPTRTQFERIASPERPNQQQRFVQFQQPPERPLHYDVNAQQNRQQVIHPARNYSPEPQTHVSNTYQRTALHPTTLDLSQNTKQEVYAPVSLNNLITPTRQAQSPGVTFRLPGDSEERNESTKRTNTMVNTQQIVTPTTETFRRSPMATTPENYPRASNWITRPRDAERRYKGDNDSGVDESTQEKQERNGHAVSPGSPLKSKIPGLQRPPSITPRNNRSRSTSKQRLSLHTPDSPQEVPLIKKVPMNKIQVGYTPSPNLKQVKSKIGSLENATHKPGGGNVKIENRKIEIKAAPRIEAKNDKYVPRGGDKKILSTKLQWNAKPKIGSLENAHHKPGGGDKKIEEVKVDFKEKAKPKIGSLENAQHVPKGGDIKIVNQKIEIKAQSKIGSLDNVKHKPGGGDKKIFDDKEYLKNVEHPIQPTPPSQVKIRSRKNSSFQVL